MKKFEIVSTAVLSLVLGIAAPVCAQQEQHEQKPEERNKPEQQKDRKPEAAKPAKPHDNHAQPQHKERGQQEKQQAQQEKARPGKPVAREQQHARDVKPTQSNGRQAQPKDKEQHAQQRQSHPMQAKRTPEQQHVQQAAWQQHRSQSWQSDHRTWRQRGGYTGYRVPEDRYRGYFGQDHGFRIYGLPFLIVGGYPRFQYNGYWVSLVDPWPGSWADDWYDTDDVYVTYVDNGYYLFNRRYPNVGIAITISI